jgi:hypothetical protein
MSMQTRTDNPVATLDRAPGGGGTAGNGACSGVQGIQLLRRYLDAADQAHEQEVALATLQTASARCRDTVRPMPEVATVVRGGHASAERIEPINADNAHCPRFNRGGFQSPVG